MKHEIFVVIINMTLLLLLLLLLLLQGDTARYAGLLLAPAEGFGQGFFCPSA